MFYFHEILKKKGKFGIIWLAATVPNRLSRRDVSTVNLSDRSKDIMDIITQYRTISGREHVRFSLYLSSQLTFGLIKVYRMKAELLLEDVKNLAARRFFDRKKESPNTIDLIEPSNFFRVTFDEPDFENAPPDFGSFSISATPAVHEPSYEYFIISTPRSPDEWQISPGLPEEHWRAVTDTRDALLARLEDITMPEAIQDELAPFESEEPIIDIASGLQDVDFLDQLFPFIATPDDIPETEREVPEREPDVPAIAVTEPQVRVEGDLPDVDDQQQGLVSPSRERIEPLPERSPAASVDVHDVPSRPDAVRRSLSENGASSSFVLGPIDVRGRRGRTRRRRRHLIVDEEIELSREQLINNFNTANDRLVRPMDIPQLRESADSMLTRFGLREAAHGNKRFWRNLRTLPEPNDPSPFGMFIEDEARDPDSASQRIRESSIPEEDSHGTKSREELRSEETLDDTHGLSTTAKTTSLQHSRTLHDIPRHSKPSLNALDIASLDLTRKEDVNLYEHLFVDPGMTLPETVAPEPEPQTLIPEPEPQTLIPEPEPQTVIPEPEPQTMIHEPEVLLEEGREFSTSQRKDTCIVSPERTPPPASPEKPSSPHIEQTMMYIKAAFEESAVPNLITFTSLIRKTPGTRKYVAKLFYVLLDFHASAVLYIQQTEPEGEIFISRGPNFVAFC